MPNRILRESITTSPTLNQISRQAECLFYRLMTIADDHGRFEADPRILHAKTFPLRIGKIRANVFWSWFQELVKVQLVTLYVVNSRTYGLFNTWNKHNRLRAAYSRFPDPPDNICQQMSADANKRSHMSAHSESDSESETDTESESERSANGRRQMSAHPTSEKTISRSLSERRPARVAKRRGSSDRPRSPRIVNGNGLEHIGTPQKSLLEEMKKHAPRHQRA